MPNYCIERQVFKIHKHVPISYDLGHLAQWLSNRSINSSYFYTFQSWYDAFKNR